jgi:hypothetical protein
MEGLDVFGTGVERAEISSLPSPTQSCLSGHLFSWYSGLFFQLVARGRNSVCLILRAGVPLGKMALEAELSHRHLGHSSSNHKNDLPQQLPV